MNLQDTLFVFLWYDGLHVKGNRIKTFKKNKTLQSLVNRF